MKLCNRTIAGRWWSWQPDRVDAGHSSDVFAAYKPLGGLCHWIMLRAQARFLSHRIRGESVESRKLKSLNEQWPKPSAMTSGVMAALEHDELSGKRRWREVDQTSQYDYAQIRLRLDRIRSLRARHDHHGLLFTLNEGIHGNMGGIAQQPIARPGLAPRSWIEQYIDEVDESLRYLAEIDNALIDPQQSSIFLPRQRLLRPLGADAQRRGVLVLSSGVVKTLLEQGLAAAGDFGSSAGSLVAGVLAPIPTGNWSTFTAPPMSCSRRRRKRACSPYVLRRQSADRRRGTWGRLVARMIPT